MSEIMTIEQQGGAPVPIRDGGMMAMIERVACDPNVDVAKLERIVDIQMRIYDKQREERERERNEAARVAYCAAFADMQGELVCVAKNRENTHTKSKYANLDSIIEAVRPTLQAHGFFLTYRPAQSDPAYVTVKTILTHRLGHSESVDVTLPLDGTGAEGKRNKTEVQATGSTITYASRYGTCRILGISVGEDNDGQKAAVPVGLSEPQKEILKQLVIKASEEQREKLRVKYGTFDNVPLTSFDLVCAQLKKSASKDEGANNANV